MTADVIQLFDMAKTAHVSRDDDEWKGLCGVIASDNVVLVDAPTRVVEGYQLCAECDQILDSEESRRLP